ncbi:hypothetical protein ACFX2I_047144 [Malus domestica]
MPFYHNKVSCCSGGGRDSGGVEDIAEGGEEKEQNLPFSSSSPLQYVWLRMIFRSLGTLVHGSSMPVFFLIFDEMVDRFDKNQMNL